jgi:hypothetical protein
MWIGVSEHGRPAQARTQFATVSDRREQPAGVSPVRSRSTTQLTPEPTFKTLARRDFGWRRSEAVNQVLCRRTLRPGLLRVEPRPPQKIHPLLEKWIASRDPKTVETLVVNFRDNLQVPRFPEPAVKEPRDSATNQRVQARNAAIIESLRARRADDYAGIEQRLRSAAARVTERFWLVRAVEVQIPLGSVRQLSQQEDVLYVEPVQTEDPPPQNANANDNVDDGRARINSDPYFALGQTGGFIGLLDSGIRRTHVQFNSPSTVAFLRDCVNGGANCNTGTLNTEDDCWNHGTSSAAIITGNNRQGAAFRGVTTITLDSFKVFPSTFNGTNCMGNLNTTAAVRGFQSAIAVADRVIVAEMQGSGDHTSTVAVAADNAFDAGAVIIAANGNNGPGASTVNAPANAHRVLGIGNFDVPTGAAVASQSRGPTADSRVITGCAGADQHRNREHRMSLWAELRAERYGISRLRRYERLDSIRSGRSRSRAQLPSWRNRCDRSRPGLRVPDHGRADNCLQ